MPPRHIYWTIIFGGQPTSFRSATRDELLPTFKQIQSKHPDAVMKFFARGKLWESPEEARQALFRRRVTRPDRRPEAGSGKRERFEGRGAESEERRGPGWRPGGRHEDPRARLKVPRDTKRKRLAAKFGWKKKTDK